MRASPKKKRGPAKTALRNAKLNVSYHVVASFANLFGALFWLFEQRRGKLLDRIDNERSANERERDQGCTA